MKTAGDLIKEVRLNNNITRVELGEMTHIKTHFIKAIEESDWASLPELAVVIGFVKSISHFLNIDEEEPVALLRRSYFLKPVPTIKPKTKNLEKKFVWGPRLTFATLVIVVLTVITGYLVFQYQKFNSPPVLIVNQPSNGQKISSDHLEVLGKTDADSTVTVNNQPVLVESDGSFIATVEVSGSTKVVKISAKSRSGKETTISRTIEVSL